ncbi:membrane-bound dehydrogenase domain protein [Pirellula staleyi DSM 6068]|uniref:Membrane-bound dehydrogenase domain protein n=1 Tax=Pirellula staleyi (strain ATCC 27377 / DSM 6068 / ICPB 4128) TaxID=530564 RepID=D2QX26_PIRSD|nr:PVC-type heme-binding CxxCH protein [Pirellula staleyi]ADB16130.1 membrane-bound dehydrogenase domain protein [Pirellula staleyi DSM 6068]
MMASRSIGLTSLLVLCLLGAQLARGDDFPAVRSSPSEANLKPMEAEEAASKIKLPEGFRATLFAAEPDVQNPIAMAWDKRHRLWIAENYTYSDRSQRFDLSHRDRVLIFEDTDNDGRADSRKVFTDQVQMLTSVELGRGGVWLMCPPQLLFIPDADGDDQPDGPPQVMLDGFDVAQDNYHNFANGLRWGPDGWLYGRCGHSCLGKLGIPGTPAENRVPIDGGIWRYHPDRKVVEVLCHGTVNPWGHDWDKNGELFFINTVIGHLWHVSPGSHYKESFGESMNPHVYERMDMIADHYHFDTRGSWTDSRDGKANDLGGGHAHIGMLIYGHDAWPASYRDKLMTINMHGQRANVERLERTLSGYVGKHEPDFFVAADPFFRGLDLSVGPDGNVFVIDWSDTGECHDHTGVHRESGRIFKISYGAERERQVVPKPFCIAGDGKLAELLRDYQAEKTTPEKLLALEHDPDEHMRVWAIRLLTDFWPLDTIVGPQPSAKYPDDPAVLAMLLRRAEHDESGLVLRVIASTMQRLPTRHRAAVAERLVAHEQYAGDVDLALLVWYGLIPVASDDPQSLVAVARQSRWPLLARSIARNLMSQSAARPELMDALLTSAEKMPAASQAQILLGMEEATRGWRKAKQPESWERFTSLPALAESADRVRELSTLFGDGRALAEIREIAKNGKIDLQTRVKAVETLIEANPDDLRPLLESLLDTRVLNRAAARGLSTYDDPAIATLLARKYKRFQAEDRAVVIEILLSRASFAESLLDSFADGKGQIPLTDITASHARQIVSLQQESLTKKLTEVWGELRDSSAEKLALKAALRERLTSEHLQQAKLAEGRTIFSKTCAQCHQLYGEGKKVGPDLTGSQRQNLDYLLENILDPSAVVGKDYRMTMVQMTDGRVLSGLVVSKSPEQVVLHTASEELSLPVDEIEQSRETNLSAMPDGLLQNLSEAQVRDLIAYLMHSSQVPLARDAEREP